MSASSPLDFSLRETVEAGSRRLTVGGDLDVIAATQLAQAIRDALEAPLPLIIDLTEVVFMDSSGLAAILKTPAAEQRSAIALRPSRHPQPRRLLDMTGALGLFAAA